MNKIGCDIIPPSPLLTPFISASLLLVSTLDMSFDPKLVKLSTPDYILKYHQNLLLLMSTTSNIYPLVVDSKPKSKLNPLISFLILRDHKS